MLLWKQEIARLLTRSCKTHCLVQAVVSSELFIFVEFCVSVKKPPVPEVSCNFSKYNGAAGQDPAPIISVPTQSRASPSLVRTCSQDSTAETDTASSSFTDQPIFFRCVRGSESILKHLHQSTTGVSNPATFLQRLAPKYMPESF